MTSQKNVFSMTSQAPAVHYQPAKHYNMNPAMCTVIGWVKPEHLQAVNGARIHTFPQRRTHLERFLQTKGYLLCAGTNQQFRF